jgi:hypothetical protein
MIFRALKRLILGKAWKAAMRLAELEMERSNLAEEDRVALRKSWLDGSPDYPTCDTCYHSFEPFFRAESGYVATATRCAGCVRTAQAVRFWADFYQQNDLSWRAMVQHRENVYQAEGKSLDDVRCALREVLPEKKNLFIHENIRYKLARKDPS